MGSLNTYKRRMTKPSQIFSVSFLNGPAVLVVLFIVWDNVTCCNATEDQHHAVSYLHHGTVCFKCPPGTFRYRHCVMNFTSPDCRPCPPQTFQSHHTQAGRCQPCLDQCLHDTNMVVVQACSGTSDLICECTGGYYLYNDGYTHTCKKHTPCDSDQFTLQNGTSTSDFVCSMCPGNQFYKGQGQCVSCTSCAALNKTQLSPCTTDEDATCEVTQDMSVTEMTARNQHESNNIPYITAGVSGVVMVIVLLMLSLVFYLKRRKHTIALPHNAESPDPGKHDATSFPLLPPRPVSLSSSTSTCHHAQFPELADPNTWTKDVFLILSRTLTRNWKVFMRNLPGDTDFNARVHYKCEQVELDVQGVPEQVYQVLQWWSESQYGPAVSVDSILYTLHKIGDCEDIQKEIRHKCSKLARSKPKKKPSNIDNNDVMVESGTLMTS
ncbi:uncharacterized protein [Haliotis cracherodii]|uniref:uncharacterized protein n=1 Tax=Haliotis cracherodii TaxID=6455 RepID=UPI0039EA57B6